MLSMRISSYMHAQHTHQFLMCLLSMDFEGPFQMRNFYSYAEHTHKELMHTLSMRISS